MADCFKLLHFHLGSQITNIRHVKAALTEAARAYADLVKRGRGPGVPRRRRRPGRRLRRLADELRIERELHAAGIRQRRRLPHADRLRRSRRAAPERSSPKAAGPSPPITRAWSSACSASPGRATATKTCSTSRPTVEQPLHDLLDTYQERHRPQRAGKLSRRPAGARRGDEPVQHAATCRSTSGPWPRTCSGRSATRSSGWPSSSTSCPRNWKGSTRCCPTRTSATSRCSSRCPTVGRSSSCSR